MKKSDKKAQMKMSFGMIFSIILIIIFIVFAFYAIRKFIDLQQKVQIEKFVEDLQSDVDKMWNSAQGSQEEEYVVPKKIEAVCFEEREDKNLFLRYSEDIEERKIEHLDIGKITENENPFCVDNTNGKIKLIIKKNYGENLVTVTK